MIIRRQCWQFGLNYAFNISRRDSTRSIRGRMPISVEMAIDSYSREVAFPGPDRVVWLQQHVCMVDE